MKHGTKALLKSIIANQLLIMKALNIEPAGQGIIRPVGKTTAKNKTSKVPAKAAKPAVKRAVKKAAKKTSGK